MGNTTAHPAPPRSPAGACQGQKRTACPDLRTSLLHSGNSLFENGNSHYHFETSCFQKGASHFHSGDSLFESGTPHFHQGTAHFGKGTPLFDSGRPISDPRDQGGIRQETHIQRFVRQHLPASRIIPFWKNQARQLFANCRACLRNAFERGVSGWRRVNLSIQESVCVI